MKYNYPQENIKATPVICYVEKEEDQLSVVIAHVVVEYDGYVIDPSFETVSQDCKYIQTLQGFLRRVPHTMSDELKRTIIERFVGLSKLTDRINNGELVICDRELYYEQHYFVQKCLGVLQLVSAL
jgi:hypothetical protein